MTFYTDADLIWTDIRHHEAREQILEWLRQNGLDPARVCSVEVKWMRIVVEEYVLDDHGCMQSDPDDQTHPLKQRRVVPLQSAPPKLAGGVAATTVCRHITTTTVLYLLAACLIGLALLTRGMG